VKDFIILCNLNKSLYGDRDISSYLICFGYVLDIVKTELEKINVLIIISDYTFDIKVYMNM